MEVSENPKGIIRLFGIEELVVLFITFPD